MGISSSAGANLHLAHAVGFLGDDLVGQPHLGLALPAQPAVELGVLLLERGFLGIDQVRLIVGRLEAQVVALLELLGQKRLFQPQGEDHDARFFLLLRSAEQIDLLIEGQGIGGGERAGSSQRAGQDKGEGKGGEDSHSGHSEPPFQRFLIPSLIGDPAKAHRAGAAQRRVRPTAGPPDPWRLGRKNRALVTPIS